MAYALKMEKESRTGIALVQAIDWAEVRFWQFMHSLYLQQLMRETREAPGPRK